MTTHFSLSLRLTFWFSAIFLLGFMIFGAVMWFDLAWSLANGRDRTLYNRARRLTQLLKASQGEPEFARGTRFDNFAQATPEGDLIQVFDLNDRRVYPRGDAVLTAFPWPGLGPDGTEYLGYAKFQSRHYRVLSKRLQIGSQQLRIFIAGQLEDNRLNLARFTEGLFWTAPLMLLLSGIFGYFITRRALTPVDRLIASARSISIGNLSRRLPVSRTGDELARLAETCNEMLSRLETAVGQITRFTADASHELRSPLAFIRTVAEIALRMPDLDLEVATAFRDIVGESEQASQLLADMLLLARSDSGHADAVFDQVDIGTLVQDVACKLKSFAEDKGQTLSAAIPDSPVCVMGDAAQLRRLFWILADNALKYTPVGGSVAVLVDRSASRVSVNVRDSGIGIPKAALPHIFERFYRVDSARRYEDGTGLGLAIAKWIAGVHQAHISVESEEHKGTTFRVTFSICALDFLRDTQNNECSMTTSNL